MARGGDRTSRLVDSNGAGDTFMVAVWHAMMGGRRVNEALTFAARAAAIAVECDELVPTDSVGNQGYRVSRLELLIWIEAKQSDGHALWDPAPQTSNSAEGGWR